MTAQNEKSSNDNQQQISTNLSDFSVEHILNRAGEKKIKFEVSEENSSGTNLSWLQCTRYCPPKIPRIQKNSNHRRQLGRYPRIPFTSHQLTVLENKFRQSPYLSSEDVIHLAKQLQLADVRVKIWFQNRRARERRERTQNASKSKPNVNSTIVSQNMYPVSTQFSDFLPTTSQQEDFLSNNSN